MTPQHQFRSLVAEVKYSLEAQLWDKVLCESRHFVAIPTLGHLVQGWLLVVPKDWHLCVGALSPLLTTELIGFLDEVVSFVSAKYGPVAIFEHGPAQLQTGIGCGVDHAHVHVVPVEADWRLLQAAKDRVPQITWKMASSLHDTRKYFDQSQPYLFLHEPGLESVIGTGPSIPSQLFRRIIANFVGRPHNFDWKRFPEFERIRDTVERLGKSSSDKPGMF